MGGKFILSCGSTVDVPFSYMEKRDVPVIFYSYTVDGQEYLDDMGRDPQALPRFYEMLKEGKLPSTSQVNIQQYRDFFAEQLEKGDLLHVAFGSGMSASVNNALLAAEELREEYPNRKLVVVDSLCSSSGYGLLVDEAADMRDRGCTIEETEQWLLANRNRVHHQFFSTDMTMFRRSGRVSGPTATIATILNICPIMRLDDRGRIIAYGKVRGRPAAVRTTIETMDRHIQNGRDYDGKLWVCHSNCPDIAQPFRETLKEHYPRVKDIPMFDIGTIIAAHCGPGTVAAFFMGDEREPE